MIFSDEFYPREPFIHIQSNYVSCIFVIFIQTPIRHLTELIISTAPESQWDAYTYYRFGYVEDPTTFANFMNCVHSLKAWKSQVNCKVFGSLDKLQSDQVFDPIHINFSSTKSRLILHASLKSINIQYNQVLQLQAKVLRSTKNSNWIAKYQDPLTCFFLHGGQASDKVEESCVHFVECLREVYGGMLESWFSAC